MLEKIYDGKNAARIGVEVFAGWLILCNVIIPISLYVYMEVVKLVMVFMINSDVEMYHEETNTPAHCNTSNLAEELGQVGIMGHQSLPHSFTKLPTTIAFHFFL